MLRRFFTPAPDSLWQTFLGPRKVRLGMLWGLVWILWMFGDLMFEPVQWIWWPVTIAAFVALVTLVTCVQVRPRREVAAYSVTLAALGCLIMPVNHSGSGTCVIYACVYLSLQPDVRRLLSRIVPVLLVWALETWLLHWPWQATVWITVIALAVSAGQHSMWAGWCRDAELRLSHDEVRRLAAAAERERIGRDLHDLLGHTLSMVALKSELAGRLIERDPGAAKREITDVERVARDALAQVRGAVSGIRAAALVSELASARLLLETAGVRLEYWCDPRELPTEVETCLALVLREAATNIQRHARARQVEVTVIAGADRVVMRIRDDGRGGINAHGNGLTGMRERIIAKGGEFTIESPRGQGTNIEASLPLPSTPARPEGRASQLELDAPVASLMNHAGSHA